MKEKSFLVIVTNAASAKKMPAVIAPARPTSCPPLRKPAATVRIGVRNTPAMNVKANSATTPQLELRSRLTMNSEPSIAANISSGAMIGAALNTEMKLNCMPTNAPAIVGSIDSASSQYVLRRTVFCATGSTTRSPDARGEPAGAGDSGDWRPDITGSNLRSIMPPEQPGTGR